MSAVYIVAAGMVTSVGGTLDECWASILAGKSGIRRIERFDPETLPTQIAGTVSIPAAVTCSQRTKALAAQVVDECLQSVMLPEAARVKAGVFVACPAGDNEWTQMLRPGGADLQSMYFQDELVSSVGYVVADRFGSCEVPMTLNTACASGATALAAATESIRQGDYEIAIVAGSDASVYQESIARFCLLSALSTSNAAPDAACKPFSKGRDGFVMGEGAGAVILASARAVEELGLPVLAKVSGLGNATDNFHRTRSSADGHAIVASMQSALADAGLTAAQIDHINAHGTGTPENDKMESLGIRLLFGERAGAIPITANKSIFGHTLTAAGIIEAIVAMMTLRTAKIPGTLNYEADPDLGVSLAKDAVEHDCAHVLSNSFGFGGQNVSLVLSRA